MLLIFVSECNRCLTKTVSRLNNHGVSWVRTIKYFFCNVKHIYCRCRYLHRYIIREFMRIKSKFCSSATVSSNELYVFISPLIFSSSRKLMSSTTGCKKFSDTFGNTFCIISSRDPHHCPRGKWYKSSVGEKKRSLFPMDRITGSRA